MAAGLDNLRRGGPFQNLATEIDLASAALDEQKLQDILGECDRQLENASGVSRPTLLYFKANCFAALGAAKYDEEYAWSWSQDCAIGELLALRSAIVEDSFDDLGVERKYQIRTNLGNLFNSLGRCSEAIENWNTALQYLPGGAMAKGNKGYCLSNYGSSLYDPGHAGIFFLESQRVLQEALSTSAFWDSGEDERAKTHFSHILEWVTTTLMNSGVSSRYDPHTPTLSGNQDQQDYHHWCLSNHLFLNPLNDVMTSSLAAADLLHLPNHTYKVDEPAHFPIYFNQLKQEYVSARYRLYSSQLIGQPNHADAEVLLMDNFDGAGFGHQQDDLKRAFLGAHSIFDKIAVFLNDYFCIGMNPKHIHFRNVWETIEKGGVKKLRPAFEENRNWLLRGLYYMSKDFFEGDFQEIALPEAKEFSECRNHLEHSYLVLTDFDPEPVAINHIRYMHEQTFAKKTRRLLKMSRAALIYLSLAMRREEQLREESENSSIKVKLQSRRLNRQ